jgi:hypothetical protein
MTVPSDPAANSRQPIMLRVVVILLLVATAVTFAAVVGTRDRPPATQRVVTLARNLPAFAILTSADLRETNLIAPPLSAVRSIDDATGRIAVRPLQRGRVLDSAAILTLPPSKDGYLLITVAKASTPAPVGGEHVLLVGSHGSNEAKVIARTALAVGQTSQGLVVALPAQEEKAVIPYLASTKSVVAAVRFLDRS